jgi:signal peptidase I
MRRRSFPVGESESQDSTEPSQGSSDARRPTSFLRSLRETGIIVVSALVLSALVRAFLVQAFFVPSASMEDTLMVGDRIIASKISNRVAGVTRGEIIVFQDPGGWLPDPPAPVEGARTTLRSALTFIGLLPSDTGQDLVKRAIGIPGDRVVCCNIDGRIVVNGAALDEPYVRGSTDQVLFDVVVPPDSMFVMGDNRGDSRDSRYHLEVNNGSIPLANAVGRVVLVAWPLSQFSTQPIPDTFGTVPDSPTSGQ